MIDNSATVAAPPGVYIYPQYCPFCGRPPQYLEFTTPYTCPYHPSYTTVSGDAR